MYIPRVVKIIHRKSDRGEFFSVFWEDNTKTTVKLAEGEQSDEYTAFLYALGKKIFGDKGTARKFIHNREQVFENECKRKSRHKRMQKNGIPIYEPTEKEVNDFFNEVMNKYIHTINRRY